MLDNREMMINEVIIFVAIALLSPFRGRMLVVVCDWNHKITRIHIKWSIDSIQCDGNYKKILKWEQCISWSKRLILLIFFQYAMLTNYPLFAECVNRYSVREEANGRLQLDHRKYLELCNVIITMLTWMLRSKMQLMCE